MVFCDVGRSEIRNWLAASSSTYPAYMLFGTDTTSANVTDTTMSTVTSSSFSDTTVQITRQVRYESILRTTEATGSTIAQVGLSTETGTAGTLYIKENIAGIAKTSGFDIQTLCIIEII